MNTGKAFGHCPVSRNSICPAGQSHLQTGLWSACMEHNNGASVWQRWMVAQGSYIKTATGREWGGGMDSRRSGQCVCVCTCMILSERMGLDIREVIQAAKLLSTPSIYMSVHAPRHMGKRCKTIHGSAIWGRLLQEEELTLISHYPAKNAIH